MKLSKPKAVKATECATTPAPTAIAPSITIQQTVIACATRAWPSGRRSGDTSSELIPDIMIEDQ